MGPLRPQTLESESKDRWYSVLKGQEIGPCLPRKDESGKELSRLKCKFLDVMS